MKRTLRRLIACVAAALLLLPCSSALASGYLSDDMPAEALRLLELTCQERLEDYEYFWSGLRESYPCWGLLARQGVDVDAIYEEYRDMVAKQANDVDFYSAIYSALYRLGQNGHLWLVEPSGYAQARAYAPDYRAQGKTRWADALDSPDTAAKYKKLLALENAMGGQEGAEGGGAQTPNLSALTLPGGQIGYLKIMSFVGDLARERELLAPIFQQFSGCTDLIIDLTQNSGGDERYWQQLLVAPHIARPLTCKTTALTRASANNRPYLEAVFEPGELIPIAQLPEMPGLCAEDRALATHFVPIVTRVEPTATPSPFKGKIWVLVSGSVYSASESFAVFCKQTGFATLVGTQTGGDGIGSLDPVFLQLPNSGMLIQYTALFGLNPDGGSNEEMGTEPDIISPAGETPLITALRAIGQYHEKGN